KDGQNQSKGRGWNAFGIFRKFMDNRVGKFIKCPSEEPISAICIPCAVEAYNTGAGTNFSGKNLRRFVLGGLQQLELKHLLNSGWNVCTSIFARIIIGFHGRKIFNRTKISFCAVRASRCERNI
ncbi:unnamed protein product, partial [Allacma fusca]